MSSPKLDFSGHNILNTTDISTHESPFTDHSGQSKKNSKYSPFLTGRSSLPGTKTQEKKQIDNYDYNKKVSLKLYH